MTMQSETFGRLLRGAINSIAAYEGKTALAIEDDLGAQIGVAGSAIQRYKAGSLPPESKAIELLASAGKPIAFVGHGRSGLAFGDGCQELSLCPDVLLDFKQMRQFTKHGHSNSSPPGRR